MMHDGEYKVRDEYKVWATVHLLHLQQNLSLAPINLYVDDLERERTSILFRIRPV